VANNTEQSPGVKPKSTRRESETGLLRARLDLLDSYVGCNATVHDGQQAGEVRALIRGANDQPAPVPSLDAQSGIDATSGQAYDPSSRAVQTMTTALPKMGLQSVHVGEFYLAAR
jgi:NAD(P)H-hydrate repair Nnr-like enzyme with NAD(P)H-hydrate epimerase domain